MTEFSKTRFPNFFVTAPSPCPYLPGKMERKVFTHLAGGNPQKLNNVLSRAGFRRSQAIAYRPACDDCSACLSVRVRASDAPPTRSQRRIMARNADLVSRVRPAEATREQFRLLHRYLAHRHHDGGMAEMDFYDYAAMVEESPVDTYIVEYRRPNAHDCETAGGRSVPGELVALCLNDRMSDGHSLVYSFYTPDEPRRSLGTFMILDHIRKTREEGLGYVYLGYWIEGCRKMTYKTRFQPIEGLGPDGWEEVA